MKAPPALLIAGTHSGCGKTTITLAVMAALKRRGLAVRPFKCGPDFIDPSLHTMVTGQISRNLDVRMCGESFVRACFARHNPSLAGQGSCAVVEGVMGLFDGAAGSAAHLAKTLGLPVILVVNVRSAAESVAAVVKGFATLDPALDLAGVIGNQVGSALHAELIRTALKPLGIPLLGLLPRNEGIAIPSRHLGLHMGEEAPLDPAALDALVQLAEQHLDMPLLLRLAEEHCRHRSPAAVDPLPCATAEKKPDVRIGVARDAAFSFYYADNLDMLAAAGAELVPFSPLTETSLPKGLHGLYLGGGYPELHAETLAANSGMRAAIRRFSEDGHPVYAECGGFMYLCRSLRDLQGTTHPMCGVFPFDCAMNAARSRLGYRQVQQGRSTFFGPEGLTLLGHEFHYSSLLPFVHNFAHKKQGHEITHAWRLDTGQDEGYFRNNTLAGYVHLHWGRSPQAPVALVQACRSFVP